MAIVEIKDIEEAKGLVGTTAGNGIESVERDQRVAFQRVQRIREPAARRLQREVGGVATAGLGRRAGRQGEMRLAGAVDALQVHGAAGGRLRERAQLRDCCRVSNIGFQALVGRIAQSQRHLLRGRAAFLAGPGRAHAVPSPASAAAGAPSTMMTADSASTTGGWPAYSRLWV